MLVDVGSVRLVPLVGDEARYDGNALRYDDAVFDLVHRSQDDDAMVALGQNTRLIPCLNRWVYVDQYMRALDPLTCIACAVRP